jgi:hypothetical protein
VAYAAKGRRRILRPTFFITDRQASVTSSAKRVGRIYGNRVMYCGRKIENEVVDGFLPRSGDW